MKEIRERYRHLLDHSDSSIIFTSRGELLDDETSSLLVNNLFYGKECFCVVVVPHIGFDFVGLETEIYFDYVFLGFRGFAGFDLFMEFCDGYFQNYDTESSLEILHRDFDMGSDSYLI